MSITPGPNNVMLTAAGANFGLRRTVPHILGVTCGFAFLVAASCGGLGLLFTRFPEVHAALRWVGAAYLLFLGWQLLRAKGGAVGSAGKPVTFWEAAAFQFLNPKAWVIALTAATLFLPPQLGQFLGSSYVATIITLVNLPCITVWAVFGSSLGLILTRPGARRAFNWVMAVALAATGVMMVT
ncbi:MAG TPA: LysE family translocator [Steroidobacteraceae bacterium]|jgi:threonine/homoserine/homoserine lactone efflux protein|nr:LysE family translocator [Steroidobacteraceae bacterium]